MIAKQGANGSDKIGTGTVGTRYPLDRIALLDVVVIRRGLDNRSDLVKNLLDECLVAEGLLGEAA